MKKTTKISNTLVFFIVSIIIGIMAFSYWFYKSADQDSTNMINRNDPIAVDSVKKIAVKDTITYYESRLSELMNNLKKKDDEINLQKNINLKLKKDKDSIGYKLDYYRQRNKELLNRDSVRN